MPDAFVGNAEALKLRIRVNTYTRGNQIGPAVALPVQFAGAFV